jgi:uncharacterized protein YprB with RNaseH-like and TPR domain
VALSAAFEVDDILLSRLGAGLRRQDVAQAAYLDIETTGLSGEMGAFAFLVGVGTFENLAFRVRQFFLTDLDDEPAMLTALTETLERCRCIVTFNGSSFDLPQLLTWYAMAGLPAPLGLPHIDLLHPARRLYARGLRSCRLAEVERELLGLRRHGDVAGASIPALYLSAMRRRSLRGLPPLFEHNSLDVLSLVAFLAYLRIDAGEAVEADAAHHLALAKWDEATSNSDAAVRQYRKVLELDRRTEIGGEAAVRLGRLLRTRGCSASCEALWLEELATTSSPIRQIRARIELARITEKGQKRPVVALAHAEEAVAQIDAASLRGFFAKSRPALEKRILRLQRKVNKGVRPG